MPFLIDPVGRCLLEQLDEVSMGINETFVLATLKAEILDGVSVADGSVATVDWNASLTTEEPVRCELVQQPNPPTGLAYLASCTLRPTADATLCLTAVSPSLELPLPRTAILSLHHP